MTALQLFDELEFAWRAAGWIVACFVIGFMIGTVSDEHECPDEEFEDFV